MLKLLNNPKSDNTRNILNADLFVSNLHNTLKAFGFNPKVTYEVYRSITVYHITWNDDKIYDDILELKKEIALSLGINVSELVMNKVKDNEIFIKVDNMKKDILCLKEVLEDYKDLTFTFRYPLNILIKDKTLLNEKERKYASHHNTHVDFLIYNEISKTPLLVIEVDGYKYHKEDNKQKERDILKNNILSKYNIPLIRLTTNGSREENIIRSKLDEIVNSK